MSTKKERMYKEITKHGEQLKALFDLPEDTDPVKLCKQLLAIERKVHRLATDDCNGVYGHEGGDLEVEEQNNYYMGRVKKILAIDTTPGAPCPVFINGDARGYALKLDDAWLRIRRHEGQPHEIYQDMGGYGIVAPTFDGKEGF